MGQPDAVEVEIYVGRMCTERGVVREIDRFERKHFSFGARAGGSRWLVEWRPSKVSLGGAVVNGATG